MSLTGAVLLKALVGLFALMATLLAAHVCAAWRGGLRGAMLLSWMSLTAAWAVSQFMVLLGAPLGVLVLGSVLDVLRAGFALGLILVSIRGSRHSRAVLVVGVALVGLCLISIALHPRLLAVFQLGLAVLLLSSVEQCWRSLPRSGRWAEKPLCLALCAGAAFELYVHSEAAILGAMTPGAWLARTLVACLAMPLAWLFAARMESARVAVAASRSAVMHSTALIASGGYLLLMSAAGFYVRDFGGQWGAALQSVLVFAGALLFVVLAASEQVRARLRLFMARHFFRLRYDYRHIWRSLTQRLAGKTSFTEAAQEVIISLAALIESPGGVLLWVDDSGRFTPRAQHDCSVFGKLPAGLARTLKERDHEVVRLGEDAHLSPLTSLIQEACLLVPLIRQGRLQGAVILRAPRIALELDWEVRDALKTLALQATTELCHWQAFDALLASRRFDETNRLATFVLHDLKNCALHLSLLHDNAKDHLPKPAFQADLLTALGELSSRMNALMTTLKSGMGGDGHQAVDLGALLTQLIHSMAMQSPAPSLHVQDHLQVRADVTQLGRVIGHLIQNAIDATEPAGRVWVNLTQDGHEARVDIHDTGQGMSEDFMRDKLFKPFHTTKPNGMGIGTFEAMHYIQSQGGQIEVISRAGEGTTMTVRLPALIDEPEQAQVAA
ncbi:MAG: hypothetical protein RIR70_1032 [Pseudomonadota bacterium]